MSEPQLKAGDRVRLNRPVLGYPQGAWGVVGEMYNDGEFARVRFDGDDPSAPLAKVIGIRPKCFDYYGIDYRQGDASKCCVPSCGQPNEWGAAPNTPGGLFTCGRCRIINHILGDNEEVAAATTDAWKSSERIMGVGPDRAEYSPPAPSPYPRLMTRVLGGSNRYDVLSARNQMLRADPKHPINGSVNCPDAIGYPKAMLDGSYHHLFRVKWPDGTEEDALVLEEWVAP